MENFGQDILGSGDGGGGRSGGYETHSSSRRSRRRRRSSAERQMAQSAASAIAASSDFDFNAGGENDGERVERRQSYSQQQQLLLLRSRSTSVDVPQHQGRSGGTERRRRSYNSINNSFVRLSKQSSNRQLQEEGYPLLSATTRRTSAGSVGSTASAASIVSNNTARLQWKNDLDAIGLLASTVRTLRDGTAADTTTNAEVAAAALAVATTAQALTSQTDPNGRRKSFPSLSQIKGSHPSSRRHRLNARNRPNAPTSNRELSSHAPTTANTTRLVIDAMPIGAKWRSSHQNNNEPPHGKASPSLEINDDYGDETDDGSLLPPSIADASATAMTELSPTILRPNSSITDAATPHDLSSLTQDTLLKTRAQGVNDSLANLVSTLDSLADAAQDEQIPSSVPRAVLRQVPSLETALTRIRPVLSKVLDTESPSASSGESMGDGSPLATVSAAYLDRIARLVDMLSQTVQAATELKSWNRNSDACYATALELLDRACVELRCIRDLRRDPCDIPWRPSSRLRGAWTRSGHRDKLRLLLGQDDDGTSRASSRSGAGTSASAGSKNNLSSGAGDGGSSTASHGFDSRAGPADPELFREVAVEVILQSLQWAPDDIGEIHRACSGVDCSEVVSIEPITDATSSVFNDIPGISPLRRRASNSVASGGTNGGGNDEPNDHNDFEENTNRAESSGVAPIPIEAERLLSKIKGGPLPREDIINGIARRFLPYVGFVSSKERNRRDEVSLASLEFADSSRSLAQDGTTKSTANTSCTVCVTSVIEGPVNAAADSRRASQSVRELFFGEIGANSPQSGDENTHGSSIVIDNNVKESPSVGMTGLGKTIIAAMLVSRKDIRKHFAGGIAWLDIRQFSCVGLPRAENPKSNNEFMRSGFSYDSYIDCLRSIRDQLKWDQTSRLAEQVPQLSTDADTHEQQAIERLAMTQAKLAVASLFRKYAERRGPALLVLDGVTGDGDLQWFQFANVDVLSEGKRPTVELLVTTRLRNLNGVNCTIEIDRLDEDEALELLSRESDQHSVSGSGVGGGGGGIDPHNSAEARTIVSKCGGHPLTVRSAARWCQLKRHTAGSIRAIQEVCEEVTSCIEADDDGFFNGSLSISEEEGSWNDSASMRLLFKIGNRTLSPVMQGQPTRVIKLCFAALTKVFFHVPISDSLVSSSRFPSPFCSSRPFRVPLETATLLWMELIRLDEDDLFPGVDSTSSGRSGESITTQKRRKHQVSLISEALGSLGVVNIFEDTDNLTPESNSSATIMKKYVEIHHDALQEYGKYLCTESSGLGRLVIGADRRWNKCFVTACLAAAASSGSMRDGIVNWDDDSSSARSSSRRGSKSSVASGSWLACREYSLHMLVSHMIRADMLREAKSLLKEDRFVKTRLRNIGWEEGTKRHVEDCEEVCRLIRASATRDDTVDDYDSNRSQLEVRSTLVLSYAKVTSLLCAEARAIDRREGTASNGANSPSVEAGQALRRIGVSLGKHRCWAQAVNHYKRSLEFLQRTLGNHEVVASMLYDASIVRLEVHDHYTCVRDLGQCLTIRERVLGAQHSVFLRTVHRMGVLLVDMCKYAQAMDCFERVIGAMVANSKPDRVLLGDALLSKGCLQLKRGEAGLAIVSFDAAIRAKKNELGEHHPSLARIQFHAAKASEMREDNEDAIRRLKQAKKMLREPVSTISEEKRDIEESMFWLVVEGTLSDLEGQYDRCIECFQGALRLHRTKESGRKGVEARLRHSIACAAASSGDNKKAMSRFEDSLRCRTARTSRNDLEVADTLFEMGCLHQDVGKYEKSRRCLDESLRIRKLQLGDSHIVAATLARLGDLHKASGNSENADSCYDEALRVRERLFGEDHESVATALHERASQSCAMNDFGEAMAFYEESLELRKKLRGNNHPDVADTYYSMGGTLINNREYDRAFECLNEALRIRRACFGKDHPTVGDVLNRLGYLQYKFQNHQVALQFLWEALRIRKEANVLVKVADSLNHIGTVHMEKQQYALAHECYEESLRVLKSELGDTHKKVADAYIALGDVQSAFGEHKDACSLYRKGLNILRVHGDKYDRIAPVLQDLGVLELKAGNLDNSMNYLQEFIVLRKESGIEPDIDYVNALHIVGKIHRSKGEDAEAGKVWAEAYTIYKEKDMATDHPSVGEALQGLLRGIYDESRNYENSFFRRLSDRWSGSIQNMANELRSEVEGEESGTITSTSQRSIADIANFMDDTPEQRPPDDTTRKPP